MDLTQVYKVLRLFCTGKKNIHHHRTCSLRWDKCRILTKHQSRRVGQVGSISPQGEKIKCFHKSLEWRNSCPGSPVVPYQVTWGRKRQGKDKDTVGDTATCEEKENFFLDDDTLLSLPNPLKKEYRSATSKTLSKHWRKTKSLNFHLISLKNVLFSTLTTIPPVTYNVILDRSLHAADLFPYL